MDRLQIRIVHAGLLIAEKNGRGNSVAHSGLVHAAHEREQDPEVAE